MPGTSSPGKTERPGWRRGRRGGSGGYVLLDALVALFLTMAALVTILGGLALAGGSAARQRERIVAQIAERNRLAEADSAAGP